MAGNRGATKCNAMPNAEQQRTNVTTVGGFPVGELWSEPLSVAELRPYFGNVNRNLMHAIIRRMGDDVERYGRRYRIKLSRMPVAYWRERGLLD